ncbi:MAG: carbohydrate ABC transporter permease [Lautropia sp.]
MRGRTVLLLLYLLFAWLPIQSLLNASLQGDGAGGAAWQPWPGAVTWAHWQSAWSGPFGASALLQSLLIAAANTVLTLLIALPAAYALARARSAGASLLRYWLLVDRMTPAAVAVAPLLPLFAAIGLLGSPPAVVIALALFTVPLAIWILERFIAGVPCELDEIAQIDRFSFARFFCTVLLPAIGPGIAIAVVASFLIGWGELLLVQRMLPAPGPLAARLASAAPDGIAAWRELAAATLLAAIPALLAAWLLRRHLADGLLLGRRDSDIRNVDRL